MFIVQKVQYNELGSHHIIHKGFITSIYIKLAFSLLMTCGRGFVDMCPYIFFCILNPFTFKLLQFVLSISNYVLSNPSHTY